MEQITVTANVQIVVSDADKVLQRSLLIIVEVKSSPQL